jgi:hypothetical protein
VYPVACVELQNLWAGVSPWKMFFKVVTGRAGFVIGPEAQWDLALCDLRSLAATQYRRLRIKTFLRYPGKFPVDVRHNSKIFREKLAVWADKELGADWPTVPHKSEIRDREGWL